VATKNEIVVLIREHEAIRAQIEWMTDCLSSLAKQSSPIQSVQRKDQLWSCRLTLHDLREGIRRHIELDERIFKVLDSTSSEDMAREHEEIRKVVDNAVSLADNTLAKELSSEELNEYALNIGGAVTRITELIKAHTAREDRLLRLAQKEL
jgi:hemerythrin-like domain-containing protein